MANQFVATIFLFGIGVRISSFSGVAVFASAIF
jgi:hypothetical protein